MTAFLYLMVRLVTLLLTFLDVALLLRAIFSWFPDLDDTKLGDFIYMVTEPVLLPVRNLFSRFSLFQNSPIDLSFLITVLLLSAVQTALGAFGGRLF